MVTILKIKILKKFFVTGIIVPAERTRLLREPGISIEYLWRNSNERMSNRTMKSIIAYLLAFTMMATIASQAFLPAVAAMDAQSSVSVVQVQTEPEEETGAPASQQPDETDPETVVTEEPASSEAASEESTSSEATSEESTSSEATSEESASSEVASEESTSSETASSEAASEENTSSEAASSEAASEEAVSSEVVLEENALEEQEKPELLEEVEEPTETEPNGGVSVVINAAMVMGKNVDFVMTLYRNGEEMPVAKVGGQLHQNKEGEPSRLKLSETGLEPAAIRW